MTRDVIGYGFPISAPPVHEKEGRSWWNGTDLPQSQKFRIGHRHGLDSSDLVVWIEHEAVDPFEMTLTPR